MDGAEQLLGRQRETPLRESGQVSHGGAECWRLTGQRCGVGVGSVVRPDHEDDKGNKKTKEAPGRSNDACGSMDAGVGGNAGKGCLGDA